MERDPSLLSVINQNAENQRLDIHTALPAQVISCNGHTATIQLMITQIMRNGEVLALPPLVDVPVGFYRGGGFCITVPLKSGDEGLAIFAERCIDGWYESGQQSEPLDNRFHDYSDAFFMPQGSSKPNKIPDYSPDALSIQTDDGSTFIRMKQGKIMIKGDIEHEGNSDSTGTMTAGKGVFAGIDIENHTHPDNHGGNTGVPNK